MRYSQEDVLKYLPHRDPFLFVQEITAINLPEATVKKKHQDRVMEDLLGGTVYGLTKVNPAHPILAGHFPGHPIFPGVLQIEMVAQVSSFLFSELKSTPLGTYKIDVALLGVDKARFKRAILPGMELKVEATMRKCREWIFFFEGAIFNQDKKCSECEFMASLKFVD